MHRTRAKLQSPTGIPPAAGADLPPRLPRHGPALLLRRHEPCQQRYCAQRWRSQRRHRSSDSAGAGGEVDHTGATRQWIATCTDQERGWVPRRGRERWLGLMWEVESLRRGAVFGRSHEEITLCEGGSVATRAVSDYNDRAAASKAVMRAGCHYAQFTAVSGMYVYFGVIRPGWDVERGRDVQHAAGHCFYRISDTPLVSIESLRCCGMVKRHRPVTINN